MSVKVQPQAGVESNDQHLPHPILLLVNGNSRTGRQMFGEAIAALRDAGIEVKEAHLARDKHETETLLRREVNEGARMVVVGGGDGTLSNCAQYLYDTDVAMGVLPLGTGNTFARSLGIPVELKGAVETISQGYIERVDVGLCNGQVFLNSVSLGLSAEIANALTSDIKRKLGLLSWPYIGGRVALSHRAIRVRVRAGENTQILRTHQLMIANGRYVAGPIKASEDSSLQDNELTVFALGGASKTELVRATWQWLTHQHVRSHEVPFFETQKLRVESLGRRIKANVDGEVNEHTPLDIEVRPGALGVIVPQGYEADKV